MEQEKSFVEYLTCANALYYGLSRDEVKQFAYEYAKKLKAMKQINKYPGAWDENLRASNDWY